VLLAGGVEPGMGEEILGVEQRLAFGHQKQPRRDERGGVLAMRGETLNPIGDASRSERVHSTRS
jgi:hypothetical protein